MNLVKSNGKDLNLVHGSMWWGTRVDLLRCFAGHKLPLETGVEGFEPSDVAVKAPCLTSWRYPIKVGDGFNTTADHYSAFMLVCSIRRICAA